MRTGYILVNEETLEGEGPVRRAVPSRLNGPNRSVHYDPVCPGWGRSSGQNLKAIAASVREIDGELVAVLTSGVVKVKPCTRCAEYVSPKDASQTWRALGSCADDSNPNSWFSVNPLVQEEKKAICRTCPVVEECLESAMRTREAFGVWGGLTAQERGVRMSPEARRTMASFEEPDLFDYLAFADE